MNHTAVSRNLSVIFCPKMEGAHDWEFPQLTGTFGTKNGKMALTANVT